MAPRKSSKRNKIKSRNKKVVEEGGQETSSHRGSLKTGTTAKQSFLPASTKKEEVSNPVVNHLSNHDTNNSAQQHPPDCQCYLKRGGNFFLPPGLQTTDSAFDSGRDDNAKV